MDLLEHEIRVTFRYPVYFSRDVFAPSNPLVLKAAPSAVAPKAARILFVLDSGVDAAHPALRESIGRYCARARRRAGAGRAGARHPRRGTGEERPGPARS